MSYIFIFNDNKSQISIMVSDFWTALYTVDYVHTEVECGPNLIIIMWHIWVFINIAIV